MLPTYGNIIPSINENNDKLYPCNNGYTSKENREVGFKTYNLYITSDDEIKEGDWCYSIKKNSVFQSNGQNHSPASKKIIATTDKSLMHLNEKDNYEEYIPQPSQAFIEKYCKVGGIDEVMVEYVNKNCKDLNICNCKSLLGDLIPKINPYNEITIHPIKDSWSREECVINASKILHDASKAGYFNMSSFREKAEFEHNWIKKNL